MKEKQTQNKKNRNQGFTLLELLIVVLIIGILVGIALPQYQLAVDKAHFANLQQLVKSIRTAYDDYYLIHNEYPNNLDSLDINFASSYQYTNYAGAESCVIFKDNYCCVGKAKSGLQEDNIFCGQNDYSFAYGMRHIGRNYCVAAVENTRAERLCTNLSNERTLLLNLIAPYGHQYNNGKKYYYYRLK